MKKTLLILLGITLISFNSFAQEEKFNEYYNDSSVTMTNPLVGNDASYLAEIQAIQKKITLMQLELKEKELEYKVQEQDKKLKNINTPERKEAIKAPVMPSFIPRVAERLDVEEKVSPLEVKAIRGVKGNLKASIYSDDFGRVIVGMDDIMPNGARVMRVSNNTVTVQNPNGDIEVLGVSFR